MTRTPWEQRIVQQAAGKFEPWMSCDDCFDCSDQMVEALVDAPATLTPEFLAHMRGCPACLEEALALSELVARERNLDPARLAEQLQRRVREG